MESLFFKMLLLEYFKFTPNEILNFKNLQLRLSENEGNEMNATEQTSQTLWDSCYILCKYLEFNPLVIRGKRCIELGSGRGLLGLYCGCLGAEMVVMTDVGKAVPNLQETIRLNPKVENICCRELDWFKKNDFGKFDIILGSDIIWVLDLVKPLVDTIVSLSSRDTLIILADQQRSKICQDEFFIQLKKAGFRIDIVDWMHHRYFKDSVKIYHSRLI